MDSISPSGLLLRGRGLTGGDDFDGGNVSTCEPSSISGDPSIGAKIFSHYHQYNCIFSILPADAKAEIKTRITAATTNNFMTERF